MIHLLDQGFVANKPAIIQESDLNPANLSHLRALRPDTGEKITFLNLKGGAVQYKVSSIKPISLEFETLVEKAAKESKTHLYLCPPLGSALDQTVEQATEVG